MAHGNYLKGLFCSHYSGYSCTGEYIALLPLDENGDNDDGQVFLYRFIDNGEDAEPDLENIEDDQEFERVSNAFNELMEEQDFADIDLDELED